MTDDKRIVKTAAGLGAAIGVSRWTIQAIRKAGKMLGDPIGNYASPDDVLKWLRRHPGFVATHYLKKPAPPSPETNPEAEAAGKSGGSTGRRGQRRPLPAESAPPLERVA